ncbi:serine threonine kinase [Pyrenophora seminiperda CCB06]|uniref:EKC/KEOPS complex subunit BUD32 n=1 Tax=Pyrenophora seminiperda CCB06 TaxID=1302712 RepID=A0A3M7MC70_9PLEO|nr:serine threonine kinase [Pyrenophora seminiperda CCB06]
MRFSTLESHRTASDPNHAMNPYEFITWSPAGVKKVIDSGGNSWIGLVDENTVLKYPLVPADEEDLFEPRGHAYLQQIREEAVKGLEVEEQILRHLGQHPRIVGLVGKNDDGLLLEYMTNGSIESYLRTNAARTPFSQKLKWAWQAAEGLVHLHNKGVLHCDISLGNLLLDNNLEVKMCDFQGRLLDDKGFVKLDGESCGGSLSSMPRPDANVFNETTDFFALGTTIYVLMSGQLPFPDLDPVVEDEEVERRFRECEFPPLETLPAGSVVRKCWVGDYSTASEIVKDLRCLADQNLD